MAALTVAGKHSPRISIEDAAFGALMAAVSNAGFIGVPPLADGYRNNGIVCTAIASTVPAFGK